MFEYVIMILVVMLMILATLDLFVGVSNDAANFLNSAVGTRIAPLFVVMLVASLGVLMGATFSSGMMEVARKGMLYPEMFTFKEIMLIFASVMISDVLLLNLFNSFGLPTSTTVSIIFELLGAATFCSFFKLYNTDIPLSDIFNYIKLDRTATIVSAILLSVVLAFISGMVVQFISRMLFTFRFNRTVKYLGGVFCGISLSAISYFLIIKGARGASFMNSEVIAFIDNNFQMLMWSIFLGFTLIGQIMIMFKMNVFKLIILSGTFALAFSFAGNDLVNFVGVPLAALDSFQHWVASGNEDGSMTMDYLNTTNVTSTFWLFLAGFIMSVTLWVSKKARQVVQTSINLSASTSGSREQFGASTIGRIITRMGLGVSRTVYRTLPRHSLNVVKHRYRQPPVVKGEDRLPFDYVRASVNLVVSATLISVATSLKLPLSTTYVCFMVAMGSSFSDGAWDRESAVYRISGVVTVIAGWFLTGISAFTFACFINFILCNLGFYMALVLIPMVFSLVVYANFIRKSKAAATSMVLQAKNDKEILDSVALTVPSYYEKELACVTTALDKFFDDDEFGLRKVRNKASNISESISLERSAYYSLAVGEEQKILRGKSKKNETTSTNDAKFFFYLVFSNLREASKSVHYALDQAVNHVANRHTIFGGAMKASLFDLVKRVSRILDDLKAIQKNPSAGNVESMVRHTKKLNRDIDKCQMELVSIIGREHVSMHSSEMYLTFLQCMRDVANRYVAVSMQEHALAEIVMGTSHEKEADSQAQSSMLATAFRTDRDDLGMSTDEDDSPSAVYDDEGESVMLPKSPAAMEKEKNKEKM